MNTLIIDMPWGEKFNIESKASRLHLNRVNVSIG